MLQMFVTEMAPHFARAKLVEVRFGTCSRLRKVGHLKTESLDLEALATVEKMTDLSFFKLTVIRVSSNLVS